MIIWIIIVSLIAGIGLLFIVRKKINWVKLFVKISQYSIWFILNFIFGLLPVLIVLFIAEWTPDDSSINSLLSFSFTLLVSSIYIFSVHKKNFDIDNAVIILNIVFAVILLIAFLFFTIKQPQWFYKLIVDYSWETLGILACVTFIISLTLNYRSIEAQVENIMNKRKLSSVNSGYHDLLNAASK